VARDARFPIPEASRGATIHAYWISRYSGTDQNG
jgi:hypothetical protein